MADLLQRQILEIVIRARNDAKAGIAGAAADLTGFQASLRDVSRGMVVGGSILAGAAGVGALGLGMATRAASNFDTMLSRVQANTTLTNAQMQVMRTGIMQMSAATGAPLDQLATGFQHITNVGFDAADALNILTAANKSALSTGSATGDVANVLGMQMHEFSLRATDAAKAMDVLHLASAQSNTTLDTYVATTSKAVAMAANLGVSFTDANAALAALGRHMDISQANTAFAGELVKLVANSKGAMTLIRQLGEKTGIPLAFDFSSAGLASRGFTQVQADLAKATQGNASEMLKIIAATRGGLASLVLAGTGAKDYTTILSSLNAVMASKLTPTEQAFQRQQETLAAQQQRVQRAFDNMAITVGNQLIPVMSNLIQTINPYLNQTEKWITNHSKQISQYGPMVLGITGASGALLILGGVALRTAALVALVNPELWPLIGIAAALGAAYVTNFGDSRKAIDGFRTSADQAWKTMLDINDAVNAFVNGKGLAPAIEKVKKDLFPTTPAIVPTGGGLIEKIKEGHTVPGPLGNYPLPWAPGGVFNQPHTTTGGTPYQPTTTSDSWKKWTTPGLGMPTAGNVPTPLNPSSTSDSWLKWIAATITPTPPPVRTAPPARSTSAPATSSPIPLPASPSPTPLAHLLGPIIITPTITLPRLPVAPPPPASPPPVRTPVPLSPNLGAANTSTHTTTNHITVNVTASGAAVQGSDPAGTGKKLGDHLSAAMRAFMASEQSVTPGVRRTLAGGAQSS